MLCKPKNNTGRCSASKIFKAKRLIIAVCVMAFMLAIIAIIIARVSASDTFAKYSELFTSENSAYAALFDVTTKNFSIELQSNDNNTSDSVQTGSDIADISQTTNVLVSFDVVASSEVKASETILVKGIPTSIDTVLNFSGTSYKGEAGSQYTNDAGLYVYDCTFDSVAVVSAGAVQDTKAYTLVFTLSDASTTFNMADASTQIYASLEQVQ